MKKFLSIIALTALVVGVPSASFAAKKTTTPAATPAASTPSPSATPTVAKTIPMNSIVATIDYAGKTFTHKNKDGKEVKFVLTPTTEIKQGKADGKFEDIKVGDTVAGLRVKKSDTEYEVIKITKYGVKAERTDKKTDATAKPADKKAN